MDFKRPSISGLDAPEVAARVLAPLSDFHYRTVRPYPNADDRRDGAVEHLDEGRVRAADAVNPVGNYLGNHCIVAERPHFRTELNVFQAGVNVLLQT